MPKVLMIKNWKSKNVGSVWSPNEKIAEQLISGGFAQAVDNAQNPDEDRAPEPYREIATDSEPEEESIDASVDTPQVSDLNAEDPPTAATDEAEETDDDSPPIPQRHAPHRSWIHN